MMRETASLIIGLTLASCAGPHDEVALENDAAPKIETTARGERSSSPTTASRLTGQISTLTSGISGLNVRVTDMATIIDLPADALFEFDKSTLTSEAVVQLSKAAEIIRKAPHGPIAIVGHTDSKGEDAYNQALSEARAKTVATWFGQQAGIRQRSFNISGMGEKQPIAPNSRPNGSDDPEGRTRNRRVEVIIAKPA